MYLKSITVKGFKSFPDRTKLDFDPGTSVIVGPNGSGKSNVTDAVLWALGEQSPVAVRGASMQDVIFGGAPGRKAATSAEVELVLDDSDGTLGLGAPEIAIYRRLDRSGDGEYRLAGARCRLTDVQELLSDTGLGKEMHSVISQGRVESLVTSKPRERRMLIEEAAGLGKHRKRRRRAQLKLGHTQDNLDRALDVEREARARLRPLKRQAEAAELHERLERQSLELRWELVRDDVRTRRLALGTAETAAAEVRRRRQALSAELAATAKRREAAEEALAARSAQRDELSRRAYVARHSGERIGDRAQSVRGSLATIEGRLQRAEQIVEGLQREVASDHEDPAAAARIEKMEAELAALQRDREAELARQLAELETELTAAQERVQRAASAVEAAFAHRREGEQAAEQARASIREAERDAESARREAARVGGELAGVNQFLRNHASTLKGASALSDALEVDPGYELAVAAALDGRLAAAVVADRGRGGELLDQAGRDGGRALVGWAADHGQPGDSGEAVAWRGTGDAQRLLDHVRGEGDAVALARTLLRNAWVVEDLAACAEEFDGVAVTRTGRVWSARSRELRQAPAVGEERVLAERNRRDVLVAESERAIQAEVNARAVVQSAGGAAGEADGERDRRTAAHRDAVHGLDEAREAARRITVQIDRRRQAPDEGENAGRRAQLTAEIRNERTTLQRAAQERAQRAHRLERMRAAVQHDHELVPMVQGVAAALREAAAAVAAQREGFDAALAADREAGETAAAQLRACAQEEAGLHQRMSRENEAMTQAEVALQRSRDQAAEAEAELTQLATRLQLQAVAAEEPLDGEQREQLATRLERIARRREQLGPVNPLAQEEYAEALEHVEELERQRTDLENALRELATLIADTDKQIRTTFEETFAATAAGFEELAAQLFPGGSGRLRLVSEREDRPAPVIGGQAVDDGTDGSDGADGADGAGEGEDEDEPGREDLLGVEIEITPAGKDPKRLSLLSGGEKSMTALAFLFAVFLARPCPFYILDEVEAALDDLNISRFLTLLGQYSDRAQFIVVTHQKRTMEAADCLYGVSMASDGISKVISRRLPAAVEAAA